MAMGSAPTSESKRAVPARGGKESKDDAFLAAAAAAVAADVAKAAAKPQFAVLYRDYVQIIVVPRRDLEAYVSCRAWLCSPYSRVLCDHAGSDGSGEALTSLPNSLTLTRTRRE
jgi:hypothetical protein